MALFDGYYRETITNNNEKMNIDTKYITEDSNNKLLNEILLSIKSKNISLRENDTEEKNNKIIHILRTYSIEANKDNKSSYDLEIKKWDKISWFRKVPQFAIEIEFSKKASYTTDTYLLKIDVCDDKSQNHKIVKEIYDYLVNLDENRKKEEVNKKLENIISDISTSVDKIHRRDETINEILN